MHPGVMENFLDIIGIEGAGFYMYLDTQANVVTVGHGFVVASETEAWNFFRRYEGITDEAGVRQAYRDVKAGGHVSWPMLSRQGMLSSARDRTEVIDGQLRAENCFGQAYEEWPADAQLGALIMGYAIGVGKLRTRWPKFKAACRARQWDEAFAQSHWTSGAPRVRAERQRILRICFYNALYSQRRGYRPEILSYPVELPPTP